MTKRRRIALALAVLVAAMSVVLVWPVDVRNDPLPTTPPAATIALSGGMDKDSTLNWQGEARLVEAIRLARQTNSPRLLTTRVVRRSFFSDDSIVSDSGQARIIRPSGMESRWTILPDEVRSTRDEAVAFRRVWLPSNSQFVIVVTSASHTRRACETVERLGLRVICRATAGRPSLYENAYERLARIKYRLKGWMP